MVNEFVSALKDRVSASVQSAVWLAVAGLIAVVAAGFLVAALHTWLAHHYGPIQASLALGGTLLAISILIVVAMAIKRRRAARRMKLQRQRLTSVQPTALATSMVAQLIGPKQTAVLMLVALAAGFLTARPRNPPKG